ncbi:MAG: hypothetical protein M0011_00085 [Elusimicrobia bacterium]|nr:hypothetical protein [Elusimicrobiota bacterium]
MKTQFSDTLKKLREEAGYQTAYKFYHGCGGQAALGITYRRYLLLEQGDCPEGGLLLKLLPFLGPVPLSRQSNGLITAWMRTVVGEETYAAVIAPLVSVAAGGTHPATAADGQGIMKQERRRLSLQQIEAVLADYDTFVCFTALGADTGVWTPDELSGPLQLSPACAKKALQRLAKAGVLAKEGSDGYKSGSPQWQTGLRREALDEKLLRKLEAYTSKLADSGRLRHRTRNFFRAEAGEAMNGYMPLLLQSLAMAQGSGVTARTGNTALFYVEGRLAKVRDL